VVGFVIQEPIATASRFAETLVSSRAMLTPMIKQRGLSVGTTVRQNSAEVSGIRSSSFKGLCSGSQLKNVSNLKTSNKVFVAHQPRAWKTMWWDFIRVKCGVSLRTPSGVNL